MSLDRLPTANPESPQPEAGQDCPGTQVAIVTPSPLYTVTIEGDAGRDPEVHFHAGGQGFWIARMVIRLEAQATLCAPFGGEPGMVLRTLIESEGVALKAVAAQGWNGGYVHDRRSGERKPIVQVPSPPLTRHEIDDLYSAAVAAGLAAGVAVLTGPSRPGVLPADVYRRLARDLGENGVSMVADLSGEALQAIAGGVQFLKVSHSELIEAGYCAGDTPEQLAAGARRLQEGSGAANVIVSRAAEPALALLEDRLVEVAGPRFQARDHRGAGDSMTAGLAVGCARGLALEAVLRLAAAAGTLNVTRHGLGSGRRDSIEAIARRIEICPLSA
jgi:1-phosphofructokinase